ncbi:MAG: hypothetical protein R3A79_17580 [Nannocystaceae bacterium]
MTPAPTDTRHVRLSAAQGELVLAVVDGGAEITRTALPLAWGRLRERFVRHAIPSEAEVEHAINFIEDALMERPALREHGGLALVSADPVLRAVLGRAGTGAGTWSRGDVEALFTRYARISMGGSPARDAIEVRAEEYVALLVLREILHHLDFAAITIVDEPRP